MGEQIIPGGPSLEEQTKSEKIAKLAADNFAKPSLMKHFKFAWETTKIEEFEKRYLGEPCLSMSNIRRNKKKDKIKNPNSFGYLLASIKELPVFGWSYKSKEKKRASSVRKFIFCFFKLLFSPMFLLYFGVRLFLVLVRCFINIFHKFGVGVANSFIIFTPFSTIKIQQYKIEYDENGNKKLIPGERIPYFLGTGLVSYFAAIFPFQVMKESWGYNYGKGDLGFLILVIAAISATIIFVVGINVATIFTVFIVYLYVTLKGLRDISMGRDADKR
jgi:hypothetical protein